MAKAVGAILMLIGGYLLSGEALQVLKGQWNIYGFFLGLMIISAVADQVGIFDILSTQTGRLAKGSTQAVIGCFPAWDAHHGVPVQRMSPH